eukprot:12312261-Karenia_brevis.AAC.1
MALASTTKMHASEELALACFGVLAILGTCRLPCQRPAEFTLKVTANMSSRGATYTAFRGEWLDGRTWTMWICGRRWTGY